MLSLFRDLPGLHVPFIHNIFRPEWTIFQVNLVDCFPFLLRCDYRCDDCDELQALPPNATLLSGTLEENLHAGLWHAHLLVHIRGLCALISHHWPLKTRNIPWQSNHKWSWLAWRSVFPDFQRTSWLLLAVQQRLVHAQVFHLLILLPQTRPL